jgi:tRNA threonylcarbamoyladenosine biosynthesis protein TsaE
VGKKCTKVVSHGPQDTLDLGARLGRALWPGSIVLLQGELGSGKTVLVKGIASGLGVKTAVTSPTFVLMQPYEGRLTLFHVDLYRLESLKEIEGIGLEEYLWGDGVCAVEWAEKFRQNWPGSFLQVVMAAGPGKERNIILRAKVERYQRCLKEL